jgi:dihydrofolate reductase
MIISMIAAVDENMGLGKNNSLLCHLPADLQYFKQTTMGKPVVMGRNTYDSIGKALPGRQNIVLSRHSFLTEDVSVMHSIEDAIAATQGLPEIMIIGGAQVYQQVISIADCIYLTVIHHQFDADVFFPSVESEQWRCDEARFRPKDDKNKYDMTFYRYYRLAANKFNR